MKKYQIFILLVLFLPIHSAISCTMFTLTKDGKTLVGNNEDYFDPYAKYWHQPAEPGRFGGVYFGWTNEFPQGGMNEQGLVFDGLALDTYIIPQSGKPSINPLRFIKELMGTCSTIPEVEKFVHLYDLSFLSNSQLMFVDSTGSSLIVEGNAVHYKKGDYQISTNFRLSAITDHKITCERYTTCNALLPVSHVTVEDFKNILDKTHQEGEVSTQYSNIYDPVQKIVYLYNFHNYGEVFVIDLKKDLGTQRTSFFISTLFPIDPEYLAFKKKYDEKRQEKLAAIVKNPAPYSIREINLFAGEFYRLNQLEEAITLLKVNVQTHPDSYMAHAGLAEVYQKAEYKKEAILHYKKSIKLNPQVSDDDKEILKDCKQGLAELEK